MSGDLTAKTNAELDTLIANHERLGKFGAPLFLAALAERDRRKAGGLDLDQTLALILREAREGRFVTYKDVADQSGRPWNTVRYKVNEHIGVLGQRELARHSVFPCAMVVGEAGRETGTLTVEQLEGFARFWQRLNPSDTASGEALLRREQEKVIAFARRQEAP